MSSKKSTSPELPDVWAIVLRYPWRLVLPAFAVAAAVLLAGFLLPRRYKGEAIFERRTDMVLTEMTNRGALAAFQDPRQSIQDELAGQPAIDQLINQIWADDSPLRRKVNLAQVDKEKFRADLRQRVMVYSDIATPQLDRLRVALVTDHPELAKAAVNGLIQNYIDRTRQQIDARLQQSAAFFRGELERSRRTIEELETRKLTFEIQHAELLPESGSSLRPGSTDVRLQMLSLQQQRDEAGLRLESLRQTYESTPTMLPATTTGRNPELVQVENRVRELSRELQTATGLLQMTDKHPDVQALRQEIAALEAKMRELPETVVTQRQETVNTRRAELEVMLANTDAQYRSLNAQIAALRAQVDETSRSNAMLFPIRSDFLKLQRELSEAQRQLTFWEDNLRRVDMALAAETGNRGVQMSFIKPCGAVGRPVSPNLLQVLMAAVGLGLLAGGAGVFLAHRGDQTFTNATALAESTQLPILGSVSELLSQQHRRARRLRQLVLYPLHTALMTAALALLVTLLYLDLEKPQVLRELRRNPAAALRHVVMAPTAPPSTPE